MCLLYNFTNEREVYKGKSFFVGYKRFKNKNEVPHSDKMGSIELDRVLLPDFTGKISTYQEPYIEYTAGFHVFLTKEDANEYYNHLHDTNSHENSPTCRVLFADIRNIGINGSNYYKQPETKSRGLCVVANEMVVRTADWLNAVTAKDAENAAKRVKIVDMKIGTKFNAEGEDAPYNPWYRIAGLPFANAYGKGFGLFGNHKYGIVLEEGRG